MQTRLSGVLGVTLLALALGCSAPRAPQGTVDAGVIGDMLRAQVMGPGGCTDIDNLDSLTSPFFPDLRLYRATCTSEHGEGRTSYAASDARGLAYLLGNAAGFRFLLLRHPPVIVHGDSALLYVELAFRLNGTLQGEQRMVRDASALSSAEMALLQRAGIAHASRVIAKRMQGDVVEAVLLRPASVLSITVHLASDGSLTSLQRYAWPEQP